MINRTTRCGALCLLVCLAATAGTCGEQIVKLESRPGVEQYYLLLDNPGETYKAAVLFFPGYGQELNLASSGMATFNERGGNYLSETWRRSKTGIVVAIIDAPSDVEGGYSDDFRTDSRHMTDVSAIVRDIRARFPRIGIFLIGMSTGATSAAYAGAHLGRQVAGVVLMGSSPLLRDLDFSSIKAPVLFVHHVDDKCPYAPYDNAKWLARKFRIITVHGGDPPQSGPCGPSTTHSFFGKRRQVAIAISDWIFGRPFPQEIR